MRLIDLTGQRFSCLTVIKRDGMTPDRKRVLWHCRCDCGIELHVQAGNLKSGNSKSCGCLNRELISRRAIERSYKHGHSSRTETSPEYRSWAAMWGRCRCPNTPYYRLYGGRGVTVCERWTSFENFLADMGLRPTGRSIDRIDPYGNYEPGNCRWATPKEQRANRRAP
jgi:hypothetical protein